MTTSDHFKPLQTTSNHFKPLQDPKNAKIDTEKIHKFDKLGFHSYIYNVPARLRTTFVLATRDQRVILVAYQMVLKLFAVAEVSEQTSKADFSWAFEVRDTIAIKEFDEASDPGSWIEQIHRRPW